MKDHEQEIGTKEAVEAPELGKDEGLGADNDKVDGIGQCQSQRSFWVYHLGWVRDLDSLHDIIFYPI